MDEEPKEPLGIDASKLPIEQLQRMRRLSANLCLFCGPDQGSLESLEKMGPWIPVPPETISQKHRDAGEWGFVCKDCGEIKWCMPEEAPLNILRHPEGVPGEA